jgi:nicotinamidase-related amidase
MKGAKTMTPSNTAVILIGYQNDYFADDGILKAAVEESTRSNRVLENTTQLLRSLADTAVTLVDTPIVFTPNYEELVNPVGILKTIKDVGAFKEGTAGSETISLLKDYQDRILTVPGKRGLNAFSNTDLDDLLANKQIEHIVLAGAVTSICIDSTGRAAHERGFSVSILSDCTAGRTNYEQEFYCENIFPLYAQTLTTQEFLARVS